MTTKAAGPLTALAIVLLATLPAHGATPSASDWTKWWKAAVDGVRAEVPLWAARAMIDKAKCKISAVTATSGLGVLRSDYRFGPIIRSKLTASQAPGNIARAWGDAFHDAWSAWQSQLTIPGLPLYPSFAAVPAPQAPLTPSPPLPLGQLPSTGRAAMNEPSLAQRVIGRLGSDGASGVAQNAVKAFAADIAARFEAFLGKAVIVNIMGSGPVPNFQPPMAPVGPVVNGSCQGGQLTGVAF